MMNKKGSSLSSILANTFLKEAVVERRLGPWRFFFAKKDNGYLVANNFREKVFRDNV